MRTFVVFLAFAAVIGCERPGGDHSKAESHDQLADGGQVKAPGSETAPAPAKPDDKPANAVTEATSGMRDRTASAPIPKERWNLEYAEKTWGIKLKDFKYIEDPSYRWTGEFRLLLEFTKDLPAKELTPIKPPHGYTSFPYNVQFVILDADSVPIGWIPWSPTSAGSITGVKGDAFWVVCRSYSRDSSAGHNVSDLKGVKRVDLRPTQR
jgi:hypothetical protein